MFTLRQQALALFVDRATHQWVVRDGDGRFWVVPTVEDAWEHREPFGPTDDTNLEAIPGHYKYLLQIPI